MTNLINGKTPVQIKNGLSCSGSRGNVKCSECAYCMGQFGDEDCNYECDQIDKDALALIETLEAEIADLKLAHDCSTCGEECRDVHFYPCCACHNTAPVSMSKWHPKGTKAPPIEIPQHVLKEEEKRRRREWEEFMREDT